MHFAASQPDIVRSVRHRWLLNYWQRLRGSRQAPLWKTLDVDEFASMVENMQFCDIVNEGGRMRFIVRFCGARIVQAYGECSNEYFDEKLPPLFRDQVLAMYERAAKARQPVYTVCEVPDRDGTPVDFERLLLPFARDGVNVDRILAMLEWVSTEGGYQNRQLLRSQAQTPVYSVCATIENVTGDVTIS